MGGMDRVSIIIIKTNEMHYFLNLFAKVLADTNRTSMTNTCCCIYIVEILLMKGSGLVRNMWSTLSNKSEK
jgi:hypothetical protein